MTQPETPDWNLVKSITIDRIPGTSEAINHSFPRMNFNYSTIGLLNKYIRHLTKHRLSFMWLVHWQDDSLPWIVHTYFTPFPPNAPDTC